MVGINTTHGKCELNIEKRIPALTGTRFDE